MVPDRYPGAGPLGGLLTALDTIDSSHALILAADLPFISGSLLRDVQRAGADAAAAVVQHPDGRLALCLSVRRDCAPAVHEMWSRGARRMRDLENLVPCRRVLADAATALGRPLERERSAYICTGARNDGARLPGMLTL